jgi:outer membrane protease
MYYSFVARGGTFLYPELDGGHFHDSSSDDVVTYKQFWQIFSPGLTFYGEFNRYFDIELFFKVTPLIMAASLDEHLSRNLQIVNDPMYFGLYIEPGLVFTFRPPVSIITLSFSLNYRNISGTRGNSMYRYPENSNLYSNVGGAAYSVFDIGITARIGNRD